jgi:hypothetical protein
LSTLRLEVMKEWLGRAGSLPLRISLYASPPPMPSSSSSQERHTHIYQYLEALLPFAERWAGLKIDLPLSLLQPWKSLRERTLPLLRTFEISSDTAHQFPITDTPDVYDNLGFLQHATALSSFESRTLAIPIPCFRKENLTHFTIPGLIFVNPNAMVHFFSQMPKLFFLQVSLLKPHPSWGTLPGTEIREGSQIDTNGPLTLEFLEELVIFGSGPDHCSIVDFWQRMNLPRLRSMTCTAAPSALREAGVKAFARFMAQSSCSVLTIFFQVEDFRFPSTDPRLYEPHNALAPYLRGCSGSRITDLTVQFSSHGWSPIVGENHTTNAEITDNLLEAVFRDDMLSIMTPYLRRFYLDGQFLSFKDPIALIEDCLRQRGETLRRECGKDCDALEILEFKLHTEVDESVIAHFGQSLVHGTNVVIHAPKAWLGHRSPDDIRTSAFLGLEGSWPDWSAHSTSY